MAVSLVTMQISGHNCPVAYGRGPSTVKPFSRATRGQKRKECNIRAHALEKTWSNPEGLVLKELQPNLFVAERPFIWNNIDVGGKMAVVKLTDGSLWVHSPVHSDAALKERLAQLGPVKHIVSPNYEHVKYAQQWIEAYPSAKSYACPGLKEKKPNIRFTDTVGVNNTTPASWPKEIEVTHLSFEHNPFGGSKFFNEVLFFHVPSKTLLVTDFFWNYPDDVPFGTQLWKFGMDKIYHSFYLKFMIKDRGAYKEALSRLFSQEWVNLLPCHGRYLAGNGKPTLQRFLGA